MTPITSSDKDRLLKVICETGTTESVYSYDLQGYLSSVELEFEQLKAILYQFERLGLISNLGLNHRIIRYSWHVEAMDMLQMGGFVGQEVLLKANIEKLLMEIEHLEKSLRPDQLEKANKITSIASGILTGLSLWNGLE